MGESMDDRLLAEEAGGQIPKGQIGDILECFRSNPAYRKVFCKILCEVEPSHEEERLVEAIRNYPEMETALVPPQILLDILVKHKALYREPEERESEPALAAPPASDNEGTSTLLSERVPAEEIQSNPDSPTYTLTKAGACVAKIMEPQERLRSLFAAEAGYEPILREILAFCTTPRTLKQIENAFKGKDALWADRSTSHQPIFYPSALVEKLESSGGLEWQNGWTTTNAGKTV